LIIAFIKNPLILVYCEIEIDNVAIVYSVIDGDTFDAYPIGRVKLADIDSYECDCIGAKNFLISLIANKTVYIDVDDNYLINSVNQLVCVVYVRYNSTHIKNVNKALLLGGYATISDNPNDFNWDAWTLFQEYHEDIAPQETYSDLSDLYINLQISYNVLNLQNNNLKYDLSEVNKTYTKLYDDFFILNENYKSLNESSSIEIEDLKFLYDNLELEHNELINEYNILNEITKQDLEIIDKINLNYNNLIIESYFYKAILIGLVVTLFIVILYIKRK
jgi:hypothetical protein